METATKAAPEKHRQSADSQRRRDVSPAAPVMNPLLTLQQQVGNQAVQDLMRAAGIQAKFSVSQPDDPEEREADQVARKIMRAHAGPPASTPCACSESGEPCEECQQKSPGIHRSATRPSAPAHVPRIVSDTLRSVGHPIDAASRAFFEPRFGRDFSQVRIHSDPAASESARSIGARAYTAGEHIVFDSSAYTPQNAEGKELLAHELTHVVQQSGPGPSRARSAPSDQVLLRQPLDGGGNDVDEHPITRQQEIELSISSPGEYTGQTSPLTLSLYNFGIDIATPKAEHHAVLLELGRLLASRATAATKVQAIGFADSTGGEIHNLVLSEHRANAVEAILRPLVAQHVSVSAFGDSNPAASNDTVSGRSRNRRVDLRFMAVGPAPQPPGPAPQPPGPEPTPVKPPIQPPPGPGGGGGKKDDSHICDDFPLICGIGVIPFLVPLVCVIAPEACLALGCAVEPTLCIPPVPTTPPGEPKKPEEPKEDDGRPHVHFIPAVRATNTPSGMADRIGLRDPVHVTAVVVSPKPLATPIMIDVDGAGAKAGVATVNGSAQVQITATTALEVRGTAMTAPNFPMSPFLQLGAWWSNSLIGASNRFAVSSILEDWTAEFLDAETTKFGHAFWVWMDWVSDSGAYRDLNECLWVELVGLVEESGGMTGMGIGGVNDPKDAPPGDLHRVPDQHGTPHEYAQREGHNRVRQLWRIRDLRSNSGWVASRNSGFQIDREMKRDTANPRCWQLTVEKVGAPVSIGGLASSAGTGSAKHIFHDLNCDPEKHDPTPEPVPTPVPEPTPVPTPEPNSGVPQCDRKELARRVDACIEQAEQDAKECTLGLIPFTGGWGGAQSSLDYLACLDRMRERLLKCDRRAKQDTHCEDGRDDSAKLLQVAGLAPSVGPKRSS
jgi:outer membrane protein OmpA-like peptidoglycan-associated protein